MTNTIEATTKMRWSATVPNHTSRWLSISIGYGLNIHALLKSSIITGIGIGNIPNYFDLHAGASQSWNVNVVIKMATLFHHWNIGNIMYCSMILTSCDITNYGMWPNQLASTTHYSTHPVVSSMILNDLENVQCYCNNCSLHCTFLDVACGLVSCLRHH